MTTKTEILTLIRLNCQECLGGPRATERSLPVCNAADIADCTSPDCAFYEFRFGKDPWPNQAKAKAARRTRNFARSTAGTPEGKPHGKEL